MKECEVVGPTKKRQHQHEAIAPMRKITTPTRNNNINACKHKAQTKREKQKTTNKVEKKKELMLF